MRIFVICQIMFFIKNENYHCYKKKENDYGKKKNDLG